MRTPFNTHRQTRRLRAVMMTQQSEFSCHFQHIKWCNVGNVRLKRFCSILRNKPKPHAEGSCQPFIHPSLLHSKVTSSSPLRHLTQDRCKT